MVEKFYEKQGYPELDKHDKKAPKFTYYDMLDFAEAYYNKDKRKFKTLFVRIVSRIISMPFIFAIIVITGVIFIIRDFFNFIIFGGEMVVYRKGMSYKTIKTLLYKLDEKL